MAIPKYDELFEPVLRFLADGKEHTSKEMIEVLVGQLGLNDEERNEWLPSKRQRVIDNRIGWARTYLKKAGLMSAPRRGVYRIERLGLDALASGEAVTNEYLDRYEAFRDFKKAGANQEVRYGQPDETLDVNEEQETPDEAFGRAYGEIVAQLADELLDEVMKLSPVAFERMVLNLMSAMGYGAFDSAARATPTTGDEGIDGVIMQDKLGFDLIFIQAKLYSSDHVVGRPEVQGFVGAIAGRGGNGLFVTTSRFSRQATEYAAQQHLILIDGERLSRLMIEHDFGVSTKRVYAIKAVDTDVFNGYVDE